MTLDCQVSLTPGGCAELTPSCLIADSNKDAALGRSLVRDLYCNGQWSVFSRLTAIVPHGGTIGYVRSRSRSRCSPSAEIRR